MRNVYLFIFLTLLSGFSHSNEQIEKILDASGIEKLLYLTNQDTIEGILTKQPRLERYRETIEEHYRVHGSFAHFERAAMTVYSDNFSEEELVEINEFYSTKHGQYMYGLPTLYIPEGVVPEARQRILEFVGTPLGQRYLNAHQEVVKTVLSRAGEKLHQDQSQLEKELGRLMRSAN